MKQKYLNLEEIVIDGGTQPRAELNLAVVAEYAEEMQNGATFRPIHVVWDGQTYRLADGFHRYHAAKQIGLQVTNDLVTRGTVRDAILVALSANHQHGLRRTNEDKRRAVSRWR